MNDLDIKKVRLELDLTHRELAEQLGVDRRTIVNYEQGRLVPESKKKLIELLLKAKRSETISESSIKIENNYKEQLDNSNRENLELKDHIKTLKNFIKEKTIGADFLKAENIRLKEEIERLKKD